MKAGLVSVNVGLCGLPAGTATTPALAWVGTVFAVTARYGYSGPGRTQYVVTHVPTGFTVNGATFRTKRGAIAFGNGLLKLMPASAWDCADVKQIRRRMSKSGRLAMRKLARKCGVVVS